MTLYFGSLALARPASKTPNRVSSDPAASSVPDAMAPSRVRPASTVSPAPAAVHVRAAFRYFPALPIRYGSLTMAGSCSTPCIRPSSIAAPVTAVLRDGPASATGVNAMVIPPPAAVAEDANTNGEPAQQLHRRHCPGRRA